MDPATIISLLMAILPEIPNMITDVKAIWNAIFKIRVAMQQSNVWTAEAETAWQQALLADGRSADWQPDAA
jgi:hypothetical protein